MIALILAPWAWDLAFEIQNIYSSESHIEYFLNLEHWRTAPSGGLHLPRHAPGASDAAASPVVSASLDGTVRAFDLIRYKNFRTMVTPKPCQLTSLAVDPSGDVVVAGAVQPFDIYMWHLRTGRLIEVLPGHTGPVATLAFAPASSSEAMLASGSWDKTVKLWSLYQKKAASGGTGAIGERAMAEGTSIGGGSLPEELAHDSDVLALAYRPDGREICAATLSGSLTSIASAALDLGDFDAALADL